MAAAVALVGGALVGLLVTPRHAAPSMMVSERHNQAYKETIKLFEPLPTTAPLHRFPLISLVPGPDHPAEDQHLVHTSVEPLLTPDECDAIIAESEEWATRAGGWTSTRHFNHPTIDIPLAELPRTRAFLNADALPSRIYPLLGHAFESTLPNWRALRVADAVRAKPRKKLATGTPRQQRRPRTKRHSRTLVLFR